MKKKVAVLLTCHNRKDKTIACLQSLYEASLPNNYTIETFLVDDGSTDGTAQAVNKNFSEVNVMQGTGNLFWNQGMRLAWKTAAKKKDYDFYLWLNDDVLLFDSSLSELLEINLKKPGSIICGTLCSKINGEFTYGGKDEEGNSIIPNGQPQKCYSLNGNVVLIPKNIFALVGNLDSIFPHAIGDYDYGLRAHKKGIVSFTTNNYIGYCERNTSLPAWCLPQVPIKKRIKSLYSPLGNSHPYYYFIYENRHFGLITAIKHLITIHLRLLFPKLWIK